MKLRKITIMLLAAIAWICGGRAFGAAGGVLIYKDYSFDPDSQAEIADYTSYDHYSSVDNVVTPTGETLRIMPAQEPIYIPHAGDPHSTSADMTRTIVAAEKRFPQFAAKLDVYRRDWAAVPSATPKPSPTIAAAPQPTAPVETAEAAPAPGSTHVLYTKTGEALTDWKVTAMEGDSVVISHADGISRIPIMDLPDNLFGLPADVTARAEQLRQQARTGVAQAAPSATAKTGGKGPGKGNHHRPRPTSAGYDWE